MATSIVSACNNPAPPTAIQPVSATKECSAPDDTTTAATTRGQRDATPAQEKLGPVTFNEHVLPILAANGDGRVYKCTVCHDQYRSLEPVRADLDRILASARSRRMPIGGTPMTADDLAILDQWRTDGYQPGALAMNLVEDCKESADAP